MTSNKQFKNILNSVINIYTIKGYGWCRNTFARDQYGKKCELFSDKVNSLCLQGAIEHVLSKKHISSSKRYSLAQDVMFKFSEKLTKLFLKEMPWKTVYPVYNDVICTSKKQLLTTLDLIINEKE